MTEKDVKINKIQTELDKYKESAKQLEFVLLTYTRKLTYSINSGEEGDLIDAKKLLIKVLGERDLLNNVDSKTDACDECPLRKTCETLIGLVGEDE